ncbi:alpha-L-rhamnosidase [Sphingomonas sp. PAMC 26605]|uniref:alpha-L-rhamnosidase n=1 Tax=Sphingomonas sp. PAMC 26605 TaxID=1112214 RepID=UPI00026CC58D|nr:alpha-L-rhamnosidase [Sphingomonas sp. PAMC 26605]
MGHTISRRGFILTSGSATLVGTRLSAATTLPLHVEGLQADNLVEPANLHSANVRLSWHLRSDRRGVAQKAYRVGVATSRDRAAAGQHDLWDSGRVESDASFDVRYAGTPLASRMRCFWTVEIWDDLGVRAKSGVGTWTMGLLDASDWTGPWIGAETATMRDDRLAGLKYLTAPAHADAARDGRSYRLVMDLPESAEATIFLVAGRQAEMVLDGKSVALPPRDHDAFGPPPPYRTLTPLAKGRRVLAVYVPGEAGAASDARPARCALLVRVRYASGRVAYFQGDAARSAVGRPASWSAPAFDDRSWDALRADGDDAPFPGEGAFLLRRSFDARRAVRSARLYMTALGAYVPMLNGVRVGEQQMTPEWTDFRQHVLYRAYDVTKMVKPGANLLGAIVGDGWYGSYMAPAGRYGFGSAPLRLRAQLELEYEDGGKEVVTTDDKWSLSRAAITSSEIYDGEDVDARLNQPDWSRADFAPPRARWEPAHPIDTPSVALLGGSLPPIRPTQVLKPKSLASRPDGSVVVDFGQNFAGWVRLRVKGAAGRRVTLRFAELLGAKGAVDQSNLRAARATDSYVLRGDPAGEQFEPTFTYHGFRYVQIEGLPGGLVADAIDGVVVHSSLTETGELTLGQYVPQRMWQNGLWSQRSNFFGTPTDCPQRDERLGWTGDAHVFWDTACFNMDAAAFTRKFMLTMREAQREDGSFPDIAPNGDREHFTPPGSSPGWGDAGVFVPWTSWQHYGDTTVIDEHWQAMDRFVDSLRASNPNFLWQNKRGNDFGDWLSLDGKEPGDPTTPKDLIGTAMWKGVADAMADMAQATGRTADARRYRAMSETIVAAFNRAYVRADGGVGNDSQTSYILALHFDILPAALRTVAADRLVADIVRRGKLLSTGFLGTPYSLDVLAEAGHDELVYDLLLRTAYPSWGYMIADNATTIWERWNGDVGSRVMNSFNHYALGAVAGFMFRRLAGISQTAPGFSRFRFDPVYDRRMAKAGGRYDSQAGTITTRWERSSSGAFSLEIGIPPNSRCELCLPAASISEVRESGRPISSKDFRQLPGEKGVVLDVGAGTYRFDLGRRL